MKYQTDPELMFNAKSDCFIFSILKIHEIVGHHEFTRKQIKQIRKVAVRADFHGQDGYINEKGISGIASVASGRSRNHVYIKRVTSNDHYNFLIARFSRYLSNGDLVTHFVLSDIDTPGRVVFDPWSEDGARTTMIGNITGYRYLFAEKV